MLKPRVLYRKYAEYLYIINLNTSKSYVFVAGDILPVIQNNLMITGLETAEECLNFERYIQIDLPEDFNNFDSTTKLLMTNTLQNFPMPFVIPRIRELVKWKDSAECRRFFPEICNAGATTKQIERSEPVEISKGRCFDLTKNNPLLRNINVNFEWEQAASNLEHGAFLLNADGKVDANADFIFYKNPFHASESVMCLPCRGNSAHIKINLTKIPDTVRKIAFVLMSRDGKNFQSIREMVLKISDKQTNLINIPLRNFSVETAIVATELYLHKGEWKLNTIELGFSGGLKSLCQHFGIAAI